ncbi:T9SS type B sorting domain-containing protein [Inquilinus sp. KBS0705]|nr:T9SS type B sorting domain-containing protein [Inquilinus sp. KBS0705]
MTTQEGCASIANSSGGLLFYTNGITIWNKNHDIMKNGDGLFGDLSSTQSAIIVPCPDNDKLYYVFTVSAYGGGNGLNYSVVNITGDGGLGDVTTKNTLLMPATTEKLTAVLNSNGKDVWVIGHKAESNVFCAWLLTVNGISTTPVLSTTGTPNAGGVLSNIGTLKASPNGSKLALGANDETVPFVELFDFDISNGTISNPQKLTGFTSDIPYGIEFSPNGKLLYISEYNSEADANIYQVKLPVTPGLVTDNGIILSKIIAAGSLQLGPDGKIYLSQYNAAFLHVINSPNTEGLNCNFKLKVVNLNAGAITGATARLGLPQPNIISFDAQPFSSTGLCASSPTVFQLLSSTEYESIVWDFGDPASGNNNITTDRNPTHQFAQGGDFKIKITLTLYGITTSYTKTVNISPKIVNKPIINPANPVLCAPGSVNLTATGATGNEKYNWYDANKNLIEQNTGSYLTKEIGVKTSYYVTITNGVCEGEMQKLDVVINKPLATIAATNTIINIGETVTLTANDGAAYNWSPATYLSNRDGKVTTSTPLENITYKLIVTNESGCTAESEVNIIVKSTISIPNTFTPNDDGINDRWVIKNINYTPNVVQVYNRLGALVYSARNYDNSWAGTYTGKKLPAGVYYYRITLDSKEVKSGYVTIIR